MKSEHTFVICAYQESPYLEECIQSVLAQKEDGAVLIATATPNDHIQALADRYGLEVRINRGAHGIAQDWEFALRQADTPYVTLAHQDDIYEPDYAPSVLSALKQADHPIIAFTDYFEMRGNSRVYAGDSGLLKTKQRLLSPLKTAWGQKSVWLRRRSLSLGNAICCPSVTYVMERMPDLVFQPHFKSNVDWQTWEVLSKQRGMFVYVPQALMGHRVHEGSTTTQVIGDGGGRTGEDYEMFCKFWPASVAKLLVKVYARSQKSNQT